MIIAPLKIPPFLGEEINTYCTSKDPTSASEDISTYLLHL